MPVVRSCCGICDLLKGGKVLAWNEIILNVLVVIFTGIVLNKDDDYYINTQKRHVESRQQSQYNPYSESRNHSLDAGFDWDEYRSHVQMIRITLIVYIILKFVIVVTSVILLVAAMKRRKNLILPYLFTGVLNIIYFIYANVRCVMLIDDVGEFLFWVVLTLALALNTYFWLCMFSLYQEMKEHDNRPPQSNLLQSVVIPHTVYKEPELKPLSK